MLQPRRRRSSLLLFFTLVFVFSEGLEDINTSPRRRRQDSNDVTTVLLVDSHGRSSFGRFLSVKPDLGLITSTARTFIQEGVTTEYATQVLGTTLDNGRLYAHLLTKSSRVLYDGDSPSKSHEISKKWSVDPNLLHTKNFIRNTDFIHPSRAEPVLVFPTKASPLYPEVRQQISEEEILEEEPSNNFRVPYEVKKEILPQNNVKIFKINPQMRDLSNENVINHKEDAKPAIESINASKVRPWDDLPTFTVRNEFSPSGFSYLGDFPEFDVNTEKTRPTTVADRRAKLLFRAGLRKPEPKDFETITYSGFADFTTTVGDTIIVFTPHTTEPPKSTAEVTKISVEPTIRPALTIRPSQTIKAPSVGTTVKTFLSHEPEMETQTVEGHKLEMKTLLPTMVIDKTDRQRRPKEEISDVREDMEAKSAVLAHEQQIDDETETPDITTTSSSESVDTETTILSTSSGRSTIIFSPDVVQPSESQTPMLSTPSDEDIRKILASLQAQAALPTQPLNTPSTIFLEESSTAEKAATEISSGATTIFFEDDLPIENTAVVEEPTTTKIVQEEKTTTEQQITTTEPIPETTEKLTTTTQKETTTTQKEKTTTNAIETTSEEVISTIPVQETTPEIDSNEIDSEKKTENRQEIDVVCTEGSRILPTTVYKTLTYLTTFFIPQDNDQTTTSIKSNEVVSTEIGFQTEPCTAIDATPSSTNVVEPTITTTTEEEKTTTLPPKTTTEDQNTEDTTEPPKVTEPITTTEAVVATTPALETTPQEITTERRHVTESEPETTEMTTESGEEIELIFKTLYTTYTYLTTYFQDTTSSISSNIVVTTNVITSTLIPGSDASDAAVAGLFEREDSLVSGYKSRTVSFDDLAEIAPTKVLPDLHPTVTYEASEEDNRATPILNDAKIQQNGVKTYYTTYTYFTTIFVDGETEISSRTEVYTNYVTPSIQASAALGDLEPTQIPSLFEHRNQVEAPDDDDEDEDDDLETEKTKKKLSLNVTPLNKYNSTINRQKTAAVNEVDKSIDIYASVKDKLDNNILATGINKEQAYVTLQRGTTTTEDVPANNELLNLNEYETIATMVTDVRSTTSEGGRRFIDSVDKRNALEDQVVSESNNDSEIIPSPTLLLQTSYTTFTYFTTMYHGTSSSNVVSRLETVTNVVTETLTPTHTLSVDDLSLPITYFTTFTYWTTLYKDGTTKTTSREETVSNVVTPTPTLTSILPTISITETADVQPSQTESIQPSTVGDDLLTTYFTTYTYYTTSYVGDSTVINSRLETSSTVVNSTADVDSNQIGRAIGTANQNLIDDVKTKEVDTATIKPTGLLSTIVNTIENAGTTTILSTDVFGTYIDGLYAKVLESTSSVITPTIAPSSVEQVVKPTGVVSINKGKIVDAEGISTLYYTTQAVGTYIDNLYAQVIESTSSLEVNEERKAALATDVPISHRTGLVRLIEGSIIQNETTTLYQSKVLGTVIDGRYAQIIESTSSFLVGKASSISPTSVTEITPTPTQAPDQAISPTTTLPISPSPAVLEGSLTDASKVEEETSTEESEEEIEDDKDDRNTRVKSRLTFQSRKRTFTPAIRPFASRPRPTFAPKRKGQGATTVTRSDVTPTVTAVPASKPARFGNRRTSSTSNLILPTASGGRRFSRPKATNAAAGPNSSFGGGRRSSTRIQPTATGFAASSRRGGFRSSAGGGASQRASSLYAGNSRFRIRPTLASTLNRGAATATPSSIDDENDLTTVVTDSTGTIEDGVETTLPLQTTTEGSSRRSQNPLLKFRRPPLTRASTPRPKPKSKGKTTTTTTPKPKSTFSRSNAISRPRSNSLFPRRNLFTTSTTPPPEEEDEEDLEEEGENEDEDTDYESSQTNTQTEPAPTQETRKGRSSNIQIKPFVGFRRRSRREVNYSRFRRPGARTTAAPVKEEPSTEAPTKATKAKPSRFQPRSRNGKTTSGTTPAPPPTQRKRISPTKASSQGRSQFTLREKDTNSRSNFRRPSNTASRSRTTVASRPKSPRLRTTSPPESRKPTRGTSSRRRTTTKQRASQEQIDDNFVIPKSDGTITVTHAIPTEVTIPVVNGKITEYKNVITAKYSTEVLAPKQYSTSQNAFGKDVTVLLAESTSVADNGATLITQFVLNETPTTSVIFTPTYIRGRKTSFSHVIPSTAYGVEEVVNTIQPALAAQAPLANILLSQLLLGQNPLYPIQNPAIGAATPTTEFKTRATTYVTTVTSRTSTVLPITFRGKEILTTIVDSSVSVVTATEFLTDTVVVTPTLGFPAGQQLNTLLLPLLQQQLAQPQPLLSPQLQQQQLQQQLQQPAGVFNLNNNNNNLQRQDLYNLPQKPTLASEEDRSDEIDQEITEEVTEASRRRNTRKKNRKPTPAPTEPPKETSVITLYVSGRIPGEFSTVLSTVTIGEDARRKREAPVDVKPSKGYDDLVVSTLDYYDTYVTPATREISLETSETLPTESLESIIGDVNKHVTTHSSDVFNTKHTKSSNPSSKKYKINVTDLDEKAPLMPKVETSLTFGGNKFNNNQNSNYVSKQIGHEIRFKRDLNESEVPKPRRKVVKKLVRVQPHKHDDEVPVTTRRPRRRLVLKKKKRKLRLLPEEPLEQATKQRRKVVVTRKRLLLKTDNVVEDNGKISSSPSQTVRVDATTSPSSEELDNSITSESADVEDSTEAVNGSDEDEEVENSTEEKAIDSQQHVPDYEPFFPELSESLDAPILLLKTTVLSSVELLTKTVVQSRLRTYTFIVTRVNGDEHVVTSTTEVKPQTKTLTLTEPLTKFTTLTLLDFDATSTLNPLPMTPFPASSQLKNTDEEQKGRAFEEARYNLATRVMSNGVEVIVAGDKSTLPGEPDVKRILPSTIYKPITLKPSTLSDHMMMMLPQDASDINSLASLYPNQFVTKTCLTTFTYLTTYLESGTTTVSSHEQVVSNIATEERNTGKILPTPAMGITLTQYPNLSVGVFHTTYTYLNTILDGEQPLVVTSTHTVTNTVTAPDDYLSLLQPSERIPAIKDTNTYYSTVSLMKTVYEGDESQVVSTNEVLTQVVITESVPPKATSVMTSYIALDFEDHTPATVNYTTTDVVKTYFVTYTYYNTLIENGQKVIKTNVSTSTDIVTEKLYLHPKRPANTIKDDKKKHKIDLSGENFHIVATKTYHTTFTYFTTLLQNGNTASPTVISSHSKVVENVVTETIDPNLLDKKYLSAIKDQIRDGSNSFAKSATLNDGQKLEVTVIADQISPTKVLPIERTKMPQIQDTKKVEIESSTPNVITGSTIIFLDDEPPIKTETPSLSSSKVLKKTKTATTTSKLRRSSKTKVKTQTSTADPTKVVDSKPATKIVKAPNQVSDLLGLGSININALTPVLNAMAGLIQTNLKTNRRNDTIPPPTTPKSKPTTPHINPNNEDLQNRSPIYIPVGGVTDDFEVAESQNVATYHLQENVDWNGHKELKPTHESPLLNGGIPISPGDVITANSDVIVGKPGRIGPRIPSIPLNQVNDNEDDGYGMKPPPVTNNKWPKRNHEYKHIPVKVEKPIIHAPNKDDYVGPPPPLRVEKHKHIPLNPPVDYQVYANSQNNYGVSYGVNEVTHEVKIPNIPQEIQKNYDQAATGSFPIYAEGQPFVNDPIKNYNLQPSIVLPEVVERSTGQPLLVNIQPSQVAFVNIPHNRTTALIYGGSTEPHRNGQYFDDPSPYPEPEFSAIESFNNGVPQFASVYNDVNTPNQKQVGGVIKVAPQPIDKDQIQLDISPSRPNFVAYPNPEININVPPISFGMVQQNNEFNAHVINHGDTMRFRPPPLSYEVIRENENPVENIGTVEVPQTIPLNTNTENRYVAAIGTVGNPEPVYNGNGNRYPGGAHVGKPQIPHYDNGHKYVENAATASEARPTHHDVYQNGHKFLNGAVPVDTIKNNGHIFSNIVTQKPTHAISFDPYKPGNKVINNSNVGENTAVLSNKESDLNRHPHPFSYNVINNQDNHDRPFVNDGITDLRLPTDISVKPAADHILNLKPPSIGKPFSKNSAPPKRNFIRPISNPHLEIAEFMTPPPYKANIRTTKPRPQKPLPIPLIPENEQKISNESFLDDDDDDDDLTNEEGEVIQESNDRPLRFEILKTTTTTAAPVRNESNVKFPNFYQEKPRPRPVVNFPRPFAGLQPEHQQTNQINHFEPEKYNYVTTRPDSGFITYIGSITAHPIHLDIKPSTENNFVSRRPTTIRRKQSTTTLRPASTYKPETPSRRPVYHNASHYSNSYGHRTRQPIPVFIATTSTTQKSIINEVIANRPKVTSLPIDSPTSKPEIIRPLLSQTEKPFKTPKPLSITDLLKRERVTTVSTTTVKDVPIVELNTGEIPIINESDMEIMKPPPLVPAINMKPPKIEIHSPSGNIHRVPSIEHNHPDLEGHASTSVPYVPKPAEDIVPPPPNTNLAEEVVGMSPPPLVSTHKPLTVPDTTTVKVPFTYEIRPTTDRVNIYTRKPFTRRPTTVKVTTRRPLRPHYDIYERNRTTIKPVVEESSKITPTPSIVTNTPSLEVIIGNPSSPTIDIASSETEFRETVTSSVKTETLPVPTTVKTKSTTITSVIKTSSTSSTSSSSVDIVTKPHILVSSKEDIISTAVHHGGNEVRIIDDTSTPTHTPTTISATKSTPILASTTRKSTTPKPSKTVIPTRYITHTKTSTVTITKTTVVKTLGGPPLTSTLLVTKTEKSTIVDTVTEFHTLVKPTSIIETVTTTVSTGSSLYPPDVYGSTYPAIKVRPTTTSIVIPTIIVESAEDEDLDDFIINVTDPPIVQEEASNENDSIFVVMTDKNQGSIIKVPNNSYETQDRDEILTNNEANNVLLGGIFIASPPSLEEVPRIQSDKCEPECKASRNELCQKVEGIMRCVCRPGFARMFPDRPCIPTYTYNLKVDLERFGRENLHFNKDLTNPNSTRFTKLTALTHEALDRMVMQSDLRDIYHGVHVHSYAPRHTPLGVKTKFYLQLSDNTDEKRLEDVFKKYLRNNNYSLGGTEIFASRESLEDLRAEDFNECTNSKFHDCSENAQCFNLKGTYTCSCKEGYADLSENILYPGRVCSAELIGCEKCNYHGTCYSRGDDQSFCECFHWYTGESCHINLKVLLIALVTLGVILFGLLLICIIMTCCRKKPKKTRIATGMSFLPQRVANRGTLDRRAMIQDTSSEDSRSETNAPAFVPRKKKLKGALKKPSVHHNDVESREVNYSDQKDRSLTVMIPRAKYHPAPPTSVLSKYTTFDASKPSVPPAPNESKLLSYLDAGPTPSKSENKRKYSNAQSDSYIEEKPTSRKTSGALVSAGFEVSATVLGNNMGTLGTTCGTEADRSENATLIQKISADLLSSTGTRSQFNTLRDDDIDPVTNWMDIAPRINTVSEARSYDETTIPPPMKSFRGDYDSKPSSQHQNDEANTMAERDLGSTFLLPHTHLYKPDRGSDISGFESL